VLEDWSGGSGGKDSANPPLSAATAMRLLGTTCLITSTLARTKELCPFIEGKGRVHEWSSAWHGGGERFCIRGSRIWGVIWARRWTIRHTCTIRCLMITLVMLTLSSLPPFLTTLLAASVSDILFSSELVLETGGIQDLGHFFFSPLPLPWREIRQRQLDSWWLTWRKRIWRW
jgi:hypothetical protein